MDKFELFETDCGMILAFMCARGECGVLAYSCEKKSWEYYPAGSLNWDAWHQSVYRNFRANRLTLDDLQKRSIPAPPTEENPDQSVNMEWKDNFVSELHFSQIEPKALADLKKWSQNEWKSLYLIMSEDEYETQLGDGKFLVIDRIFRQEKEAMDFIERMEESRAKKTAEKGHFFDYTYYLKKVRIKMDESLKKAMADLNIQNYEHCSLDVILAGLAKPK